jgi:hypothetical protein
VHRLLAWLGSPVCAALLGHSQGLFYQIGGDRESVDLSDRFLEFTRIVPIGGVVLRAKVCLNR